MALPFGKYPFLLHEQENIYSCFLYRAGKGVKNPAESQKASVTGAIAAAHFIRAVASAYEV